MSMPELEAWEIAGLCNFEKKDREMKRKIAMLSIVSALAFAPLPARADITAGGALGAVAGGLLGSQVGQGNGRIAASALGAVLGFNAGQSVSQPVYGPPPGRVYMAPPPVYAAPYYRGEDDGYRYYRRGDDD